MLPVAVRTGLEPATPGVTGRYSNQLNYRTNNSLFSKGVQRYNFSCYSLHLVDNFFGFLVRNRLKASESPAVSLDDFLEHGLWSNPNAFFTVHRLIYDNILERLGMLCNVKDTIYVALEMSVVFPCHVSKGTKKSGSRFSPKQDHYTKINHESGTPIESHYICDP